MAAAVNYQSQTTSNIAHISQRAAVAALNGDLSCVYEMREAFDRRRKVMTSMLNAIDGVSCAEPDGAFYCYPIVSGLFGRALGPSGDQFRRSSPKRCLSRSRSRWCRRGLWHHGALSTQLRVGRRRPRRRSLAFCRFCRRGLRLAHVGLVCLDQRKVLPWPVSSSLKRLDCRLRASTAA